MPNLLLEIFNTAAPLVLLTQIKRIGLSGRTAEKVVEAIEQERQQYAFTSLKDVVLRIKGLTYEKMIALIEVQ